MGFRFRKSFGKGPFRMTLSKSGISTSFGVKGARITNKANGSTMTTFGIPGTGISYVSEHSHKNSNHQTQNQTRTDYENYRSSPRNYYLVDDPNIAWAPQKAGFLRIACYVLLSMAAVFACLIVAALMDNAFILSVGTIVTILIALIKSSKWRESYYQLKVVVPFEQWQDDPSLSLAQKQERYNAFIDECICYNTWASEDNMDLARRRAGIRRGQ